MQPNLKNSSDRYWVLYQILRSITEQTDLSSITQTAIESIISITNWSDVIIALPDEEESNWVVNAAAGRLSPLIGQVFSMTQGAIGRAFQTAKSQLITDTATDPDDLVLHPDPT